MLVLVAHPDDAEIAVGGTIAKLRSAGVRVVVAVMTVPEEGNSADQRVRHTEEAAATLGYELCWLPRRYLQVEAMGEVQAVREVDQLLREVRPSTVLTHWRGDGHVDHRLTANAALAALRNHQIDLYAFRPGEPQTPAAALFSPTVFVDITDHTHVKAAALHPFTLPRPGFRPVDPLPIDATDQFYGRLSGCDRAEAFVVERQHGLSGVPT